MELTEIASKLFEAGVIQFKDVILKSGIKSPIYFDLRILVSYPDLLLSISKILHRKSSDANCKYSLICGVPYTALPIATLISSSSKIPMVLKRREMKDYGTKKMVEGSFKEGEVCLIIEDVVTSGSSVLETYQSLIDVKLLVKDAIVLLDRQQGGYENLNRRGIKLHSVFTMESLIKELLKSNRINNATSQAVLQFIEVNKVNITADISFPAVNQSLAERIKLIDHPISKKLFEIILNKKSNLCLAVDVPDAEQLLKIASEIGPHICCLKTHIDMIHNFSKDLIDELKRLSTTLNFLLFEDRKFSDIGNTVEGQFSSGMFKINDWADLVTVHALSGPGILQALSKVNKQSAFVLVAEMSSEGNLISMDYTKRCVEMGERCKDVIGFVCQKKASHMPQFIHMTPGIDLKKSADAGDQRYKTPTEAIIDGGTDVIIVGRGILNAEDPVAEAKLYQGQGYDAFVRLYGLNGD